MILLDTHIWIWWVAQDPALPEAVKQLILENQPTGMGISIISCWEVAKKVEVGKLILDRDVGTWLDRALAHPGITVIGLTPEIVLESTRLPGSFHRDPADQMLVATARVLGVPLLTSDERIRAYEGVETPGE